MTMAETKKTTASEVPEPAPTGQVLEWQASEYIHHDKGPGWFALLVLITFLIAAGLILIHQWLSLAVLVAMAAALAVYGRRPPEVLNYKLDDKGLTVGQKSYPYHQFRSYSLVPDVAWHAFELDPYRRFMPPLTILLGKDNETAVTNILASHLPRDDRQPDLVDRLARKLRF